MDKKKLILVMMGVVIVLLLIFNWRLTTLSKDFSVDCINFYDVNETCPCQPITPINILNYDLNLTNINFSSQS